MDFNFFYNYIKTNFSTYEKNGILELLVNGNKLMIDYNTKKFDIVGGINHDHKRIFDLSKVENWSVFMLLIKLLDKGYSTNVIYLEKCWQLGHNESGYLDVMLTDPSNNNIYMIEVKTYKELKLYTNISKPKNLKQSLSYAMQEKKH